jgi:ADP-ribosyl-[dinitrogen reductase] hydrolase
MAEPLLDRSMGALLGLAVGDALGAPHEGRDRGGYPPVSDYSAGGVHGLPAGGWTDDTAMAVCLAESLLARGGVAERDLLERFLRWYRTGENSCTGAAIGISRKTRAALERFERSGRADAAAELENAGNGAIMRLAPVAIYFRRDEAEARRGAVRQARVTHTAEPALVASECFADLLVVALRTGDPRAVSRAAASHERLARISDHRRKQRQQISSAPRAVDTLEAALWCLEGAADFEAAVIEAVNLGGDTDTLGAVAGQLAGAIFGASAIPQRWLAGLQSRVRLEDLARRLHEQEAEVAP